MRATFNINCAQTLKLLCVTRRRGKKRWMGLEGENEMVKRWKEIKKKPHLSMFAVSLSNEKPQLHLSLFSLSSPFVLSLTS